MSVEDKTRLVNNIKNRLSDVLTVNEMEQMLDILTDEISHYDVTGYNDDFNGTDDMLTAFLDAIAVEGKSPKTLKRYGYIIKRMLNSVQISSRDISVYDIRGYLSREKTRGISDRTLDGERQIYNCYFGWLHREGMIKKNPVANIGSIKHRKKVKDIFSDVDIELMKRACKNVRDNAIITFLLSTGCRISEVTSLNRSDVNLITLECRVLGKGNKERIVYLDQVTGMFLQKYLSNRTDMDNALFLNRNHKRMNPGGVRGMLKVIEKQSGVTNIHPHKFRRTLATNLIKHGMPIEEVAAILGHDKLDTTMQYVVLNNNDIKHAYIKYA